ncbi:MAG: FecR protein [Pseudomonadota bacterium]
MKLACVANTALIERRGAGLSEAEGLRLEEHLATCEACRRTANLLSGLRTLHMTSDAELSEFVRKRAINAALSETRPAHALPARHVRKRATVWAWGAIAACAVAAVWLVLRPRQPGAAVVMISEDRVTAGSVEVAGREHPPGAAIEAHQTLYAAHAARVALGHASIELSAGTRIAWEPAQRRVRILDGSVDVDVDASKQRSFSVFTEHFAVHVLGTRFRVDLGSVSVVRGRVQVREHEHQEVVLLEAQGRTHWELASAPTPAPQPAPKAGPVVVDLPQPSAATRISSQRSIATLLARARTELAERHVQAARRTLQGASQLPSTRAERAEAKSLAAECHLIMGEFAQARAAFVRVADQFAPLPAAETALFEAARIEAEHGQPARARALLQRYLTRYPSGSFVIEARRRQKNMASAP